MAITKAEIVTVLNTRLLRAETLLTLAEPIRSALYDLSELAKWPDMWESDGQALTTVITTITKPADFRLLDTIILMDAALVYYPPLIPAGLDETVRSMTPGTEAQNLGRPTTYIERGDMFVLFPIVDANYIAGILYWRYHPDMATILFSEPFREAIYNAVMMKYLEGLGLDADPKFQEKAALYQREVQKLLPRAQDDPVQCNYTDI